MILKSSSILYLFDFDGTLCGDDKWYGLLRNSFRCFSSRPYLYPSKYDIRWSILTGRPRIDKLFVKSACLYHGFFPEIILTSPSLFYKYKSNEENYFDKLNTIKQILNDQIKIKNRKINKVFYIDNDRACTIYLNTHREDYRFLAMSVIDFCKQEFLSIPM